MSDVAIVIILLVCLFALVAGFIAQRMDNREKPIPVLEEYGSFRPVHITIGKTNTDKELRQKRRLDYYNNC